MVKEIDKACPASQTLHHVLCVRATWLHHTSAGGTRSKDVTALLLVGAWCVCVLPCNVTRVVHPVLPAHIAWVGTRDTKQYRPTY